MESFKSEGSSSTMSFDSASMDVDLEMLQLFTSRIDRCRRDRESLRGLSRNHRVCLAEIDREDAKTKAAKNAALEALDAKRRVLEAELNRRYSAAVADVLLESDGRKDRIKRRKSVLQRSLVQVEAALQAVEKKMTQSQHKFLRKYVQLIEDVGQVIEKSRHVLSKRNIPEKRDKNSLALEDFRNLVLKTVKPPSKKPSKMRVLDDFYDLLGELESDPYAS